MFDVITIGSATRDIFVDLKFLKKKDNYLCLIPGAKYDIEPPFMQTGGGATNTAVSFSRFGLRTSIISRIGNDESGHLIKINLKNENVNMHNLQQDKELGTAISIIISKIGIDRTVFTYRGASQNILLKEIDLKLLKTKWFYITALRGNSLKILKPILEYAKENRIKVAINPGSQELGLNEILEYIDVLLLNKEEAIKLSGKSDIKDIFKKLTSFGVKTIAITNGKNSVHVLYHNKILKAEPIKSKVVSTLGAGDAFCSAFVASLIQNKSIDNALRVGLFNSHSVVQHQGAKTGLLTIDNIKKNENLISKIKAESYKF
ncbi:bifunctional hydroxymethylpyrimidine kinase/phosphomethylpyrimidine kinase [Candidatus Woesearchaeota archaeon]|nr:bifunctional hydroxymethylpyrimidine kinase/phosphomethylpyrimidine kinase [Candidatus Woesearchaeota archaeon]